MRYMVKVNFHSVEEMDTFTARLTNIRKCLTPPERPLLDNHELMMMLFDEVEREATHASTNEQATTKSFLHNVQW